MLPRVLALLCLCGAAVVGVTLFGKGTHAQAPGNAWITRPDGLNCPSLTSHGFETITCASTGENSVFSTVEIEVPGSTPVYLCGANAANDGGVNRGNAATSCPKRCSDATACPQGSTFTVDVRQSGTGKCISGAAADAGVVTVVNCLR
jgi:hypothetical protein